MWRYLGVPDMEMTSADRSQEFGMLDLFRRWRCAFYGQGFISFFRRTNDGTRNGNRLR